MLVLSNTFNYLKYIYVHVLFINKSIYWSIETKYPSCDFLKPHVICLQKEMVKIEKCVGHSEPYL